eukprot:m.823750 g.823750  ORF g.823750 m.823750 type:complete len:422 (+) comp23404_c0_seq1:107-1372(+)
MAASSDAQSSRRARDYAMVKHRTDPFIEHIRDCLHAAFTSTDRVLELSTTWKHLENLINDCHEAQARNDGSESKTELKILVPRIGTFHTPLFVTEAFAEYNSKYCLTARHFVRPSFNEIRHILNLAQINAIGKDLKLITLDGDCTLYSDGKTFEDEKLARYLCRLITEGVYVALVTAAGYGNNSEKYEARIQLLLDTFAALDLPEEARARFFVMGGECNFLLRCNAQSRLVPLEQHTWENELLKSCLDQKDAFLDVCEAAMVRAQEELNLRTRLIRKDRALGMIPGGGEGKKKYPLGSGGKSIRRELLDECVLRVKDAVRKSGIDITYCAFNGGQDVWVDVGNKSIGVRCLQDYLKLSSKETLHVGDQFSDIGNDVAARSCAPTAWIRNPRETRYCLKMMLKRMGHSTKAFDAPVSPSGAT